MTTTSALSSETLVSTTDFVARLTGICAKFNDLEKVVRVMPQDPNLLPRWNAMVANELGRTRQFAWKLLKDLEAQAQTAAASKQHKDADA